MKRPSLFGSLAFAILIGCSYGAHGQVLPQSPEMLEVLRAAKEIRQKWLAQDTYFFVDRKGSARLFLRREPVKAALSLGSAPIRDEVIYLISRLSRAAGVPYELTSSGVNLAIIVDSPINEGDKPNPRLWKRVGLSEEMYTIASALGSWTSGCAFYSFGNADSGQVGLSITFADNKKLEPAQIRDCAMDGIVRSFGLRSNRRLVLRSDDGYLQFVDLVKSLRSCETSIGGERLASMNEDEQKSKYVECAADLLDK